MSRGKTVLIVALVCALARNIQLERSATPFELGFAESSFHSILFLLRLIPKIIIQRMLGLNPNVTTNVWYAHEEIAMKTTSFAAKISNFDMPNAFIDTLAVASHLALVRTGNLHVEHVDSRALGFDTPNSQSKFGSKLKCTGLWITLDGTIQFNEIDDDTLVVFYTHGGGFCVGNAGMYLTSMHKLLQVLRDEHGLKRVGVLSIEYPMAPLVKHPFPTESCFYVYDYLVRETQRLRPDNVVLAGDSAGGSIALSIGFRATKWGAAGLALFSPWVGHDLATHSHVEFEDVDLLGGRLNIEQYQDAHVNGGRLLSVQNHELHMLNKNLLFETLPNTWVSYGQFEVFRDDVIKLVDELESKRGGPVETFCGPSGPHIFPLLYPLFFEQSCAAMEDCARFCAQQWQVARLEAERLQQDQYTLERARVSKLKRDLSETDLGELFHHFNKSQMQQ